jgi:hypothetical protein
MKMASPESLVLGMILGAGLMYLLDPDRGRRRRALIRDQLVHGVHEIEELGSDVALKARHLGSRARGAAIEVRARLRMEQVEDRVLEERVRAVLGRLVANPAAISVRSEHGRVTLSGALPEHEHASLIEGVHDVLGVHDVISRLMAHPATDDAPRWQEGDH